MAIHWGKKNRNDDGNDDQEVRRLMRKIALNLLLFLTLGATSAAWARETITWGVFDWPPVFILQDHNSDAVTKLGDGTGDKLLKMLQKQLPEYDHKVVVMSAGRVFAQMKQGENLCFPSAIRTPERESIAVFTPAMLTMPIQLVTREDVLKAHPRWRDGVDLKALVKDRSLSGTYVASRSYGLAIDKILASNSNTGMHPVAAALPSSPYQMLALKRIDYTLEFPQIVQYHEQRKELPAGLTMVPLRQDQPWLTGYVACTKNAWGQTAIRKIDAALRDLAKEPAYRSMITDWSPDNDKEAQHRALERFLSDRASHNYVPQQ